MIGGLPATCLAVWFVWLHAPTLDLRILCTIPLLGFWLACAFAVRRGLEHPLRTLANMVEGIRRGDYTARGRRARQRDALGDLTHEVNLLRDSLQDRRRAWLEANALVQTVLEELDTAVFAFDEQLRLRLANRAAAELLGRSLESLLGRSADDLELTELVSRSGVVWLRFPERTSRFEVRRRTFRDRGVPHTLIVVSDLSRALREEERRAWQRLIRVVGHEINNSLAPITSLASTVSDMLQQRAATEGSDEPHELLDALGLIRDRGVSLSKFVGTYSQLARLPPPVKQRLSLSALLRRLLSLEAYAGAALHAPYEVFLDADSGQLEQALLNLLKNALEAAQADASALEVVLSRTRETAIMEIRDTGCGIANPENLFVPFFTTKAGGSGIGLALSRQIIERHEGTLTLENRTDRSGCIVRIVLPAGNAVE